MTGATDGVASEDSACLSIEDDCTLASEEQPCSDELIPEGPEADCFGFFEASAAVRTDAVVS